VKKEERLLRVGVLGCGPIAQFAHFDACRKARNAELYAICDRAGDLRERMAAVHQPRVAYADFDEMLADPQVEAVIIATADQFHVAQCQRAIEAGKHVLVEKPMGVSVEECELLRRQVSQSGLVLQVGYNKRFDPGLAYTRRFIQHELGQRLALKAWYRDSAYRYTMTDNLQAIPLASAHALRPEGNPKADKARYFLLTHGSHLVDTARFLGGEIASVHARLVQSFGTYCWFVSLEFADGGLGHLDLIIAVKDDWQEGFEVYGQNGSARGKMHLPWYHKTSEVECFSAVDGVFRRPLGEDAFTYKLQIEGLAETIFNRGLQAGANVDDGAEGVRALVAISHSVHSGQPVRLAEVSGGVT
jgi:predicted dehydrogenase